MKNVLIALCLACVVLAQDAPPGGGAQTDVGTNVKQPVIDFYDSAADYFKLRSQAVQAIAHKGIPDEEIPAVLLIARESNLSANQVIDARKGGRSLEQIATEKKMKLTGPNLTTEANVLFLSEYHGRTTEEIRTLHSAGASFVAINQQFRRVGAPPKTEPGAGAGK